MTTTTYFQIMKTFKYIFHFLAVVLLFSLMSRANALNLAALDSTVDTNRAARYEFFKDFKIKGICGNTRLDLATAWGANTIRTYTPPSREQLDNYHRLGLKVIFGVWMPHQGENPGKPKWSYDYKKSGDEQVRFFAKLVDKIGDHPAILLWCLGNEVPLDPEYLRTINRMSELLHQKYPMQLTSVTIINAPKEGIEAIKKYAPDVDVIGANCYGAGAVKTACKQFETDWQRAYYISELGPQGPWWGKRTAWGQICEQNYPEKIQDLRNSFRIIDTAPRCLGSAVFYWGCWKLQKPTYFSTFLDPANVNPKEKANELFITPMAEEFCHYWSGQYPAERGPLLSRIVIDGLKNQKDAAVSAGQTFTITANASEPSDTDSDLTYRWWILGENGKTVAGPINSSTPNVHIKAPTEPGTNYVVMGYAIANNQHASGFTVPIKVINP